jgi:hypothetical protein
LGMGQEWKRVFRHLNLGEFQPYFLRKVHFERVMVKRAGIILEANFRFLCRLDGGKKV